MASNAGRWSRPFAPEMLRPLMLHERRESNDLEATVKE
jgi:hypothetical protein